MTVRPRNKQMQKVLENRKELNKTYGTMAVRIDSLVTMLRSANSLQNIPANYNLHRLTGNYEGMWALKINASNRMLIFATNQSDEIALSAITDITIFEICVDYH